MGEKRFLKFISFTFYCGFHRDLWVKPERLTSQKGTVCGANPYRPPWPPGGQETAYMELSEGY